MTFVRRIRGARPAARISSREQRSSGGWTASFRFSSRSLASRRRYSSREAPFGSRTPETSAARSGVFPTYIPNGTPVPERRSRRRPSWSSARAFIG